MKTPWTIAILRRLRSPFPAQAGFIQQAPLLMNHTALLYQYLASQPKL